MLDVRRLAVLAAVADHGSMTAAAEELAFTPSAVSQQIAALERQIGAALVSRRPRGVVLTDAGALLAEHARTLRAQLARAEADVADLLALHTGRVRIGAFQSAGARLLPDAIGAFRRCHPGVRILLDIHEPDDALALLHADDLEVAVVFDYLGDQPTDSQGLRRTVLGHDRLAVALPREHPAAAAPGPVALADLRNEPWISDRGSSCARNLLRICAAVGFSPEVAFESEDFPTISRLVASGVGVALVPDLAADQMGPSVALRPVEPRSERRISALTGPDPSPATRAMLDSLVVGQNP